jgi:hypothetical protein
MPKSIKSSEEEEILWAAHQLFEIGRAINVFSNSEVPQAQAVYAVAA